MLTSRLSHINYPLLHHRIGTCKEFLNDKSIGTTNLNTTDLVRQKPRLKGSFYAVYDSCITNNVPSRDVAFIEERSHEKQDFDAFASDEKHFVSLKEAKSYVKQHFHSQAEYFSIGQCKEPDNFFYILADKLAYMIA